MKKLSKKQLFILIAVATAFLAALALTLILITSNANKSREDSEEVYTVSEFGTVQGKFTDRKINDEDSAMDAVRDAAGILGLENAVEELTAKRTDTIDNLTYYRISQNYKGIPVYGGSFVVVADEDGNALCLTGNAEDIDEDISLTPTATQEQVNAAIYTEFEGSSDIIIPEISDDMLVVYNLDEERDAELAYEIRITANGYNYRVITSANDGTIISTSLLTLFNTLNKAMDTDKGIKIFNALNTYYYDYIYKAGQQVEQPIASKDDKKASDLLYCISRTYDFFDKVIGIKGYNGKGGGVYLFYDAVFKNDLGIMYGNNASSLGEHTLENNQNITVLVFGNECDIDIDTVAHEYMHSVEQSVKGLIYSGESGAIMEGYSDIFGELVEDWSDNNNLDNSCNWFTENGLIFNDRNMASPTSTFNPWVYHGTFWKDTEDLIDDHGGVHTNNTVISHIAYNMTQSTLEYTTLSNKEIAKLWYQTLLLLPIDCSFEELREYMELTSQQMGLSNEKLHRVSLAFDMANISVEDTKVSEDFEIRIRCSNNPDYYKNCKVLLSGVATAWKDEEIHRTIDLTGESTKVHLEKGEYTIKVYNNNTGDLLFTRDISVNKKNDDKYVLFFIEDFEKQAEETTATPETAAKSEITGTSEGLEFILNSDQVSYSVRGIGTCTDTEIIIPAEYQGLPVTAVSQNAFENCTNIVSVTFSSNIKVIRSYAFENCASLKTVIFNEGLEEIHEGVFMYCRNLNNISFPNSIKWLGSTPFYCCVNLSNITFQESIPRMTCSTFSRTGVTFTNYRGGTYFEIHDNPYYVFVGYSGASAAELHEDTKIIASGAFYGHDRPHTIIIPKGLQRIYFNNWYYDKFSEIIYGGTIAEWNAIEKEEGWDSGNDNYTIYCTDGEIKK